MVFPIDPESLQIFKILLQNAATAAQAADNAILRSQSANATLQSYIEQFKTANNLPAIEFKLDMRNGKLVSSDEPQNQNTPN